MDGGWSAWTNSGCSASCGEGVIILRRSCDSPEPSGDGADCPGEDTVQGAACSIQECPPGAPAEEREQSRDRRPTGLFWTYQA